MALRNLLLRFAFGGLLAVASFFIARRALPASLQRWTDERFGRVFLVIYAASHGLLFIAAFLILHQKPWADLISFYVPQAHAVMQGLVPYRDFDCSYAPLNPYLDAGLLRLHDSPLTILVFQIVCDILSVPFWIKFLRRFMPEPTVRKAALLYLLQPTVAWETCFDGKNQGMISLLLAVSFWAIARREIVSGLSFSLSWILVKILPILFLPTLLMGARKRARWLIAAVVPALLVYGAFLLRHVEVMEGLRGEAEIATPQNLPYLFSALTGASFSPLALNMLSLVVLAVALVVSIAAQLSAQTESQRLWKMALGAELILVVTMLVNKKSDTSYLAMCFFLLCAFVAFEADRGRRRMITFYALLSWMALPIGSFWYWPLDGQPAAELHTLVAAGKLSAWLMVGMHLVLSASYLALAFGLWRCVRETTDDRVLKGSSITALRD